MKSMQSIKKYSTRNYFAAGAGVVVFVSGAVSAAGASFAKESVARTIAAKTITFFMSVSLFKIC
ncbi:hypothetical protein MNB_SV-9-1324 [hydrothermal vent metagenome]|uniref:Uncharacterized protein n=1 Tax=hydrothermal vent metagenome TaxID=652676 RepID=A0A1W1CCL7_9ZZZZ